MSDGILTRFQQLRREGRKALVPFIVGGDPDVKTTSALLLALEDAGADLIEVGIPFSDPLADGPVIQAAAARALRHGVTAQRVLEAIAAASSRLHIPIVCLSYWNPIMQFGHVRSSRGSGSRDLWAAREFVRVARASGVAGLIVPDLPLEEARFLRQAAGGEAVSVVLLAAPTSPPDRLRAIAQASQGFIYYVSVTGTTGVRRGVPPLLAHGIRQIRAITTKPICVGFGIATPGQASRVASIADGVIIGSGLIQRIAHVRGRSQIIRAAMSFTRAIRRAV